MGGASALLSRARALALAAAVAALVAWDAGAGALPQLTHRPDVLVVALLVLPVTLTVPYLALPLSSHRLVLPAALALGVLAVVLGWIGAEALCNAAKLLALTAAGYLFVQVFEALSWVVLVALVIPWVDALSVWRGPTEYVVSEQPGVFDRISVAFRVPGEDGSANIGPPDILFFALFLAAAARFGLRLGWTWVSMVCLLALTLVLTTVFDVNGLPALPAIAVGFLAPNVDLIWRAWRARGLALKDGR